MEYFRRLISSCVLFVKSLNSEYIPSNAFFASEQSFQNVISECFSKGKLLILSVSNNGDVLDFPFLFSLPEETYKVLTFPYNSKFAFPSISQLPVTSLPFVGVFLCDSTSLDGTILLETITTVSDLPKIDKCFTAHAQVLLDRRERYFERQATQTIVTEQNDEYHQLEKAAQEREYLEKQACLEKEAIEKAKNDKIQHRLATIRQRYNDLPEEPPENAPSITTVRCQTPSGEKTRRFLKSEQLRDLLDYVSIEEPLQYAQIMYGFPQTRIEDFEQSFAAAGFMKNERVLVTFNEEEDE